ncbi:hypothetical protein ACN20G_00735 [Streptomyces sp. BI20]|uniref:hypothetical protein n=1 Tax=Streptomyces sp. BI20 TaxID=3403460 RepID=UPI003C70AD62
MPRAPLSLSCSAAVFGAALAALLTTPFASAAGSEFQYMGRDDTVHTLTSPSGCAAAKGGGGGGGRAVVNKTPLVAELYEKPGCAGTPRQSVAPKGSTPVRYPFDSVRFRSAK